MRHARTHVRECSYARVHVCVDVWMHGYVDAREHARGRGKGGEGEGGDGWRHGD